MKNLIKDVSDNLRIKVLALSFWKSEDGFLLGHIF